MSSCADADPPEEGAGFPRRVDQHNKTQRNTGPVHTRVFMRKRTSPLLLLIGVVILAGSIRPVVDVITDWWWFETVGFTTVYAKRLTVEISLAAFVGLVALTLVYGNARLALRNCGPGAPVLRDLTDNPIGQVLMDAGAETVIRLLALAIAGIAALSAATLWPEVLLAIHSEDFGFLDPVHQRDASFYVFTLPVLLAARAFAMTLVIATAMLVIGIYVTRGAVKVQLSEDDGQIVARGMNVIPAARRHVAFLATASVVLLAMGAFLERYALMYGQSGLFAGPGYAEIYGTLPLLTVHAFSTLIAALVVHMGLERMSPGLLVVGTGLVVVPSALTSIYPGMLQRFAVEPNEINREAPQINDHIEATRFAWDLDRVEELTLPGVNDLTMEDIDANRATTNNVRLWDHNQLLATFSQVQEIRTYYRFVSVDNDRYMVDGELRQTMLSPRELMSSDLPEQAQTWVNRHMTYTHGYGLAMGPVNLVTPEGLPELFIKDLPPKVTHPDTLRIDRPEVYFGEAADEWVLIGTENPEFDFPAGDENKYAIYSGPAGIEMRPLTRALFALRFGSSELIFSTDVTRKSRLLLYRNIRERVSRIAPFLTLDKDPYLVIDNGRLVWMLDAYTRSWAFPYAQADRSQGNYVRNPVKVTLDAHDGTVHFYLIEDDDPIANAWASAFPDLFTPGSELPESLRAHLRYPQDLFGIQSEMFATYHMRDHQIFYNREDEWEVPRLGADRRREEMAPYYTVMSLPGEESEEFILMRPFSPVSKPNLAAWLVGRSDGEHYGEMRAYKFPKEKLVYGPKMVAARINQDDEISAKISLWNQQGSQVDLGTLLVLPIEESLIYVQPLYLRAQSDSIPELKRVIVAYENQIAMKRTLDAALIELFGSSVPDVEAPPQPVQDSNADDAPAVALDGSHEDVLRFAAERYEAATAAQKSGDWATYGSELEALGQALRQLTGPSGETEADTEP